LFEWLGCVGWGEGVGALLEHSVGAITRAD